LITYLKIFFSELPLLRRFTLITLKLFAFDFIITNAWTGDKFFLNTYRHKSYWYYNKFREFKTMSTISSIVQPGFNVIEIGGHIGYLAQHFSSLVGCDGCLVVFEPGVNNQKYLKVNLENNRNVKIENIAISNKSGVFNFYEDCISGENNSLLPDYFYAKTTASSHFAKNKKNVRSVSVTTLDAWLIENPMRVDFLKIDVEGSEINALLGAVNSLKRIRFIMVEASIDGSEIIKFLKQIGFDVYDDSMQKIDSLPERFEGNLFAKNIDY